MRMVKFRVASEFIRDALALPEDTQIRNIVRHDYQPKTFVFYVEHPDLDEAGDVIPEVIPVFTVDYDKKPSTWLTFDWGKKE